MKFRVKLFFSALIIAVVLLSCIEIMLAAIDPWGLRYFDDLGVIYRNFVADEQRGYRLADGEYQFHDWTATMRDGTRLVPDSNRAATCEIAVLGDSIAFGYGGNDSETWVNGLAKERSAIRFVNAGVVGYNSAQVLATRQLYPQADAYLYFVTENDAEPAMDIATLQTQAARANAATWIGRYISFMEERNNWQFPKSDLERFFSELDQILAEGRVTLTAYADRDLTLAMLESGYPVNLIPMTTDFISFVDRHPNALGQRRMAEQLMPVVDQIADAFCPA